MKKNQEFIQFAVKKNVALAPMSTFKIGGRTEYFCLVETPEKLISVYEWAKKNGMKTNVFAGGSNTVFPDKGLRGLTIRFSGGRTSFDGTRCTVDGGVVLGDVIKKSLNRGFKGLETLSGIPGTVGGAVVGNAGAYGRSISGAVERIEVWDGKKRRWVTKGECKFAYRDSVLKHEPYLLLRVGLKFEKGSRAELLKKSREIIKVRERKYKPGIKCPGSFFKNILVKDVSKKSLAKIDKSKIIEGKIPAGYLLESVGSKGMRVGKIEIASFHGNLFVNKGGARAADVKKLSVVLKKRVYKKFGIRLEEEVRYVE